MAVADRLDIGADRVRVVVDVPVGESPVDGERHILPALEHAPDLEALVKVRGGVLAGLIEVEDGAADGALEPRLAGAGEGGCAVAGLSRGRSVAGRREHQVGVVFVVEAVQPGQDEVGRADHGAHGAHRRGHSLRCRIDLAHVASAHA